MVPTRAWGAPPAPKRGMAAVLVALMLGALAPQVPAWRHDGVLPSASSFASYVGKFCFDSVPQPVRSSAPGNGEVYRKPIAGMFQATVHGRVAEGPPSNNYTSGPPCWGRCQTQGHMYLMVFDDEFEHWRVARENWESLSCEDRYHLANYVLLLSEHLADRPWHMSRLIQVRESVRPRFWYFVFVNCGATVLEPVQFWLHARNVNQGFQAEFGFDMQQTVPLEAFFGICFACIALSTCMMTRGSRMGTTRSRPLLYILRGSALLSAAGCGWLTVHHTVYAGDGIGLRFFGILGDLCACVAKAFLAALLLFVARGWALLKSPHVRPQLLAVAFTLLVIIGLTVACEVHAAYFHDQSTSFYMYESFPGFIIMMLNMLLFLTSWLMMWGTYHQEESHEVRCFYVLIFASCGIFFISLPVMCALAHLFDPWVRRKYIERIEIGSRFTTTFLLLVCLRPSQLDTMLVARLHSRKARDIDDHLDKTALGEEDDDAEGLGERDGGLTYHSADESTSASSDRDRN